MPARYQKVFEPYKLKNGGVLKNRVILPNVQHAFPQGPEEWPAETMFAEMSQFCTSGAAIVTLGHFGKFGGGAVGNRKVDPSSDRSHLSIFDYENPATHNYLSQLAALAHMWGSKLVVRLSVAWPQGIKYGGGDSKSLCPPPEGEDGVIPGVKQVKGATTASFSFGGMTMEEQINRIASKEVLQNVIQELVDMCILYKSWGWDGMSWRCDRYIDKETNLRTDEYGGEIENRGRFLLELFTAIKKACGEDFLIIGAMGSSQDHGYIGELNHGYTLDESIRFLKMCEDVIDIVEYREPGATGHQCGGYDSKYREHTVVREAYELRKAGYKGVIAVNGGFHDPDEWEDILAEGGIDLISAGRPFRADPQLFRKLRSHGAEVPTPCIRCNKCHGLNAAPWLPFCSVNPKDGQVHRLPGIVENVTQLKKVAVIGGGPIGMRAACFAAERGHKVTLFEKTGYLGGKLKCGDLYSFKWPLKTYRLWLIDELARRNVEVRLNTEPEPEQIREEGFDAVIACTGSREKRPPIPGADSEGVWLSEDVYEGTAVLGQKVVVVGGGVVATDTAMHLAEEGKDITILTRSATLMVKETRPHGPHGVHPINFPGKNYGMLRPAWAIYPNLKPIFKTQTIKITPTSVTYVKDGIETTLTCDSVIVNGGYAACEDDALKYATCTQEFYLAGDVEQDVCVNLQQGNVSAYGKALLL